MSAPIVKCVVWDLDNTMWHGVLLEDGKVALRDGIGDVLRTLDSRGILQSVCSRNDPATALARLREAGLADYFLHPEIGWGAKSEGLRRIAAGLNISLDTVLFVDDDPFEREEVRFTHPQVRVADPAEIPALVARPELNPVVTPDAERRRLMYLADIRRADAEREFSGAPADFLASLDLEVTLRPAGSGDLQRAHELTVRTNQLNATGYTYSYDELEALRVSPGHRLLVAGVRDRFGDYGTVGLILLACEPRQWTLKLLLISCRVMSRGIGGVLLHHIVERATAERVRLLGEFVPTDRNRAMLIAYRFAGFTPAAERDGVTLLEHTAPDVPAVPVYLTLRSEL
jgi:FkbH-like protein